MKTTILERIAKQVLRTAILPLLFAGTLRAQVASPLADLATRVQKGDRIEVTMSDGKVLKGGYEMVTGFGLRMNWKGHSRDVDAPTITTIRKLRPDSNLNGTLLGLAGGAAAGVIASNMMCGGNDPECSTVANVLFIPTFAAGGAGIGTLIDSLIHKYDPVYVSKGPGVAHLRVAPFVSRDKKGVRLTLAF